MNVNLAAGIAIGSSTGLDVLASFEIVQTGSGNDTLVGSVEAEELHGNAGDDLIEGRGGNDALIGGAGDDVARGGDGDDRILGNTGNDTLDGGAGDDVIEDGEGANVVKAGTGDDDVVAATDAADDDLDGGAGIDKLDYSAATTSVNVDLAGGVATGSATGVDQLAGFEIVEADPERCADRVRRGRGAEGQRRKRCHRGARRG